VLPQENLGYKHIAAVAAFLVGPQQFLDNNSIRFGLGNRFELCRPSASDSLKVLRGFCYAYQLKTCQTGDMRIESVLSNLFMKHGIGNFTSEVIPTFLYRQI
jgi:hypothetical protein